MIPSQVTDNWITILFVVLLAFLVLLNSLFPRKFKDFMTFFKREQFYTKYVKTFVLSDLFFLVFILFSVLIYSFILFKIKLYYTKASITNSIILFSKITAITFWFILIRFILGKLAAAIFKNRNLQEALLFYKWIYLSKNALILFPFIVIFHYYNSSFSFLILGLVTAIILVYNYFVLLVKNQKIIFQHLFYFILYLCTLEIAPLIIYFYIVLKV